MLPNTDRVFLEINVISAIGQPTNGLRSVEFVNAEAAENALEQGRFVHLQGTQGKVWSRPDYDACAYCGGFVAPSMACKRCH